MTRTHYLVLTLAFAFCTSISSAQLPTGTPPFGSFGGGPDIINLANLNSHITVPVLHKAGRAGFNLTYDLSYDTSVWYPVGSSGSQSWQSVWNWGWTGQTQVMSGYIDYKTVHGGCNLGTKTDPYVVSWTRYTFGYFHDQFGGLHPIGAVVSDNTGQCPNDNSPSSGSATVTDGSGYTYYVDSTPAATVYPTVGGSFQPPLQAGIGATTATDRNGNQTSVSSNGAFTDTLGLVALTVSGSGTPSSPLTFTYTAPSSAPAAYTMKYTAYTVQTNFGCSGIAEYGPTSNNLVSEIDLPDSSKYTFAYEPTPGAPSNVTGRLKSVTLPTGGTITYSYTGGSNGITCADGSAATLTRATPDGTWSYAQVKGAGAASTTTVTDPQGNQTVIQFQGIYETQRQVYQGSTSGTLLLTTNTCYNAATSPCNGTAITLPITQRTVITTLPGNLQSKHFDSYSAYGMPTESDDYDYGSGAPGALLRAVTMTYAPLGNNINAFRQQVTVKNSAGAIVSQTTNNYDETPPTATSGTPQHLAVSGSRGNLTSINYPVSGLTAHFSYYDTGTMNTATDVNGAVTTNSYAGSSCGNSFPTSMSEPLSLSRSMAWNCTGGVQTSVTDENSQPTTTTYNDPYFWRPASQNFPDGGQTAWTYNSQTSITTTIKMSASQNIVSTTLLDGLGRTSQTQLNSDPQGVDYTVTTYDALGRTYQIGNPTRCNPPTTNCESTWGYTTYAYDALNRVTQVTRPDGNTVLITYTGRATQVQDEGNGTQRAQRISQADALGRIAYVCEVTGTALLGNGGTPAACGLDIAATGFLTSYTYDPLGNVLSVSQNGLNSRSFNYDGLSRLTSEANPESGTVTYAYDLDSACPAPNSFAGDLVKRVDARSIRTCLQYDALHRLTQKNYSDGTPTASYSYDQTSALGVALTNTKGRKSSESTAGASLTGAVFSYDPMRRVVNNSQCTPQNCGTGVFAFQYPQYDLAGDLLSATNALGVTFNYAYDTAARLSTMTTNFIDGSHPGTLFSNPTYGPIGLTSAALGNGVTESRTYTNRRWLQSLTAQFGAATRYSFSVNTFAPNGNVLAANDTVNGNWTYTYDAFNRLLSSNATGQSYIYDYDRFGNRWHQNGPQSSQLGFDANNHITGVAGVGYDASGNLTSDGTHSYTYDAENRLATVDGGSTAAYVYDAEGRRTRKTTSSGSVDYLYDLNGNQVAEISAVGVYNRGELYIGSRHLATYTSGPSGTTYFIHRDWLATERARTDMTGTACETITSLPFGDGQAVTSTCPEGDVSPMHFTGDQRDSESNLDHTWFRQYSSQFGRWPSPDPAGLAAADPTNPQSWNRYAYVLNDPMAWVDPLGLDPCTINGQFGFCVTSTAGGDGGGGFFGGAFGGGGGIPHHAPLLDTPDIGGGGGIFQWTSDFLQAWTYTPGFTQEVTQVNRCAAQNASSFASLAKADTRNFWTSTFLGNDAATLSNLVFGPGRGEAMASALISNPTKYALINPSVGTVFGGMPVGGTIYTASAQTVITPYGPAIDMVPTSKTVADVAGNFVSKAAVAWTAVKAVFDSGAYIKAELKCGGFIK